MRKTLRALCLLSIRLFRSLFGFGQMSLTLHLSDISCDTLRLQSYNWDKRKGTHLTAPYGEKVTFKQKSPLQPGAYRITADTTHLATLLISSEKKQKMTISLSGEHITFANSPDNSDYQQYLAYLKQYNQQMAALDQEFKEGQNLPAYMLGTLADSLTARANRLKQARREYEEQVIQSHPNTLLATIVRANMEVPDIPPKLYGDTPAMQAFVVEHYFDQFPWDDPRIFNTQDAEDRIKNYTRIIYHFNRADLDTFVVQTLRESAVNATSHRLFFERLDKYLGFYLSDHKVEHTYIKMLQYILATEDLEEYRRNYYEQELATINKNLAGDTAPDFLMVTGSGDTTSLHAFQSNYTLLFLHNPSCHTCQAARARMANMSNLKQAIEAGKVSVLTIYVEDDATLWKHYLQSEANPLYTHGWNFDQSIIRQSLYDIRTLPYLFLLDKDKRIVRKDLLVNEIEPYMTFILQNR